MLKRNQRLLSLIQKLFDAVTVFVAWEIAYLIRFEMIPGGQPGLFIDFLEQSLIIIFITVFFYTRNGLYESSRYYSGSREIFSVIKSQFQAVVSYTVGLYFFMPNRLSRLTILLYFVLVLVLGIVARMFIRGLLKGLRRSGKNLRHIVLVGSGSHMREYALRTLRMPEAGIRILKWIDSAGAAAELDIPESELSGVDFSGRERPDAVVLGYPESRAHMLSRMVVYFNNTYTPVMVLPELEYAFTGCQIEDFTGIPLINVNAPALTTTQRFIKRGLDIGGASFGLLVLSPLYLLISLLVKVTSRGPIFYGQERVSLDGHTFKMWKFRSMKVDAEKQGAGWSTAGDDRRTPIGGFLRKTSIDELPQLWNVLVGDMSLVGPRPERPVYIEKFKEEIPLYMLRHKMKTGLTGWAQVNGLRGDTSIEKRIEYDIYYIKNWSLLFDFKIIILTLFKGFVNENAY